MWENSEDPFWSELANEDVSLQDRCVQDWVHQMENPAKWPYSATIWAWCHVGGTKDITEVMGMMYELSNKRTKYQICIILWQMLSLQSVYHDLQHSCLSFYNFSCIESILFLITFNWFLVQVLHNKIQTLIFLHSWTLLWSWTWKADPHQLTAHMENHICPVLS